VKLGKKSYLFIIVGFFIIATVALWMVYSKQADIQKQLREELVSANSRLSLIEFEPLVNRQSELKQRLEQTVAEYEVVREKLVQPVESITISDILFSTAEANSVNVTEINSSGMTNVVLEGLPCQSLPLTATIEGDVNDLVAFITHLNVNLSTGVVKSVDIDIPDAAGSKKPSASIRMMIYRYQGS